MHTCFCYLVIMGVCCVSNFCTRHLRAGRLDHLQVLKLQDFVLAIEVFVHRLVTPDPTSSFSPPSNPGFAIAFLYLSKNKLTKW